MPRSKYFIQSRLLEETLILHLLTNNLLTPYGILSKCRETGFMIGERSVWRIVRSMRERELIEYNGSKKLIVTRHGKSLFLSNKCLIQQLIF